MVCEKQIKYTPKHAREVTFTCTALTETVVVVSFGLACPAPVLPKEPDHQSKSEIWFEQRQYFNFKGGARIRTKFLT